MCNLTVTFLTILVSASLAATQICDKVGLFPSDESDKFQLCVDRGGSMIRSELHCSNRTVYSGRGARCEAKDAAKMQFYNLLSSSVKVPGSDEISIDCVTAGTICSSCKQLSVCAGDLAPDGSDTITIIYNQTCAQDEHCAIGKGCTSDEQYPCSLGPFQCDDAGFFPDPYDCKKYHICQADSLDTPVTVTCPSGSFSSETKSCGYSLNSEECQKRPVSLCRQLFQAGQVTNNSRMYYICVRSQGQADLLTPSLHECPPYHIFNVATLACIKEP